MEYTKNLKLRKPLQDEPYDVDNFNQNADTLDEAYKNHDERIENLEGLKAGDNITITNNEDGSKTISADLESAVINKTLLSAAWTGAEAPYSITLELE